MPNPELQAGQFVLGEGEMNAGMFSLMRDGSFGIYRHYEGVVGERRLVCPTCKEGCMTHADYICVTDTRTSRAVTLEWNQLAQNYYGESVSCLCSYYGYSATLMQDVCGNGWWWKWNDDEDIFD